MNSKRKGNSGQLEVLHILIDHGYQAIRNDQRFVGGVDNPDISCLIHRVKCHLEIKRKEKISIYEAMEQATRDANGNALPIVVYRRNRGKWLVIAQLDDLLELDQRAKAAAQQA